MNGELFAISNSVENRKNILNKKLFVLFFGEMSLFIYDLKFCCWFLFRKIVKNKIQYYIHELKKICRHL